MRFSLWAIIWAVLTTAPLAASPPPSDDQTLDAILASPAINGEQAVWLVGRSTGVLDETVTTAEAFVWGTKARWITAGASPEAPLELADYCQVLVAAFPFQRGLMYTLFPGPRYAYRELTFRKVVPAYRGPEATVPGQEAFLYLQNAQGWKDTHP